MSSPRTLAVVMGPLTLALAALTVSRMPYPSFKAINLRRRARLELMAAVFAVAAMLLAMPQFTAFIIASAYVLSGPISIYAVNASSSLNPPSP